MEEPRHDPPNTALAKKALLGLNFFIETNRMEAFVAVYYIAFKDWNEVDFGIISLEFGVADAAGAEFSPNFREVAF